MNNNYRYFSVTHPDNPDKTQQISLEDVTTICHVNAKTAERWRTGSQVPHPSALRLLQMYAFGEIPLLDNQEFSGMRFKQRGYGHKSESPVLVTNGWSGELELTAKEINWYVQTLQANMRNTAQLNIKCEQLEKRITELEQPTDNVIAFAPFLRRKEYYQETRA